MKFIYTSDVHGDERKYLKLIDLCREYHTDKIVIGGDLFAKHAKERIPMQIDFINGFLKDYYRKLKDNKITYIGIVGNDDLIIPCESYYEMIKDFPNIIDVDCKKYNLPSDFIIIS